jgi:hypothetical protein
MLLSRPSCRSEVAELSFSTSGGRGRGRPEKIWRWCCGRRSMEGEDKGGILLEPSSSCSSAQGIKLLLIIFLLSVPPLLLLPPHHLLHQRAPEFSTHIMLGLSTSQQKYYSSCYSHHLAKSSYHLIRSGQSLGLYS